MQNDGYDRRYTEMMGTTDVNIKTELKMPEIDYFGGTKLVVKKEQGRLKR